jgi:hypothetical protein
VGHQEHGASYRSLIALEKRQAANTSATYPDARKIGTAS